MAAKRDFYDVLGVRKTADDKEIKKAYRKLAKKYHPDTNQGDKDAEQKFKEIGEAYDVLSDPEKRKMYDQFGMAAFEEGGTGRYGGAGAGGFGGFGGSGGFQEFHFDSSGMGGMDDILKGMFGGGFGGFGGGQRSQRSYSQRGQDVTNTIQVTFDEAAFGCDKTIRIPSADGRGETQTIKVHIPAGIDEGQSIRLKGKGMPGTGGGPNGNMMLKVHILEKAGIERKGMDVYKTANIPFTTAVFGGEAKVDTLTGSVVVKIPAGTQSGKKIRLKGKGIQSMKNSGVHGDLYIRIQIEVPTSLSQEEQEALREFERLHEKTYQ